MRSEFHFNKQSVSSVSKGEYPAYTHIIRPIIFCYILETTLFLLQIYIQVVEFTHARVCGCFHFSKGK